LKVSELKKDHGARKIIADFPRKIWSIASVDRLLRSGAFCKSECSPTAAGSVTLNVWKNDCLRNGTTLTSVSLTEQSDSGDSDYVAVSVRLRMKDTLNIIF